MRLITISPSSLGLKQERACPQTLVGGCTVATYGRVRRWWLLLLMLIVAESQITIVSEGVGADPPTFPINDTSAHIVSTFKHLLDFHHRRRKSRDTVDAEPLEPSARHTSPEGPSSFKWVLLCWILYAPPRIILHLLSWIYFIFSFTGDVPGTGILEQAQHVAEDGSRWRRPALNIST